MPPLGGSGGMVPQKIFEKKDALRRILVHSKLNFLPYPYPRKHNLSHKFSPLFSGVTSA